MDISKQIAALKAQPGFAEKVGMVLVHNGVVRATSRASGARVAGIEAVVDQSKIRAICAEYTAKPGIFKVLAESRSGSYKPGDDLLFIVVAGDFRENVLAVMAEALNRIKKEAIAKKEILE
ncbi:MAG: molybdenum cofactor biosynthesis protein MoaE [Desulfovibrionaceae bacterium]|nr:molybdenum cofactor biosynthesis protein MoaE [Desulfovibrionaceae bacterium]MBF0513773.1 molybdenum cofactor biosynthesis protein MoaE [Desulfovibrionaceae bacterium]